MDARCYEQYALSEDILMEHAARGMADVVRKRAPQGARVLIVAGPGNNGGDGMVLARQLHGDYDVRLVVPKGAKSQMARVQLQRAKAVGVVESASLEDADIIVDALFGAGLSRPLDDASVALVEEMNAMNGYKIACDIPTGIDTAGNPSPIAFRADVTVTMGALKEALYADGAKPYTGEVVCADLGVARTLYEAESETFLLEADDFTPPRRRRADAHKGTYGHAAIFCGEKEGAAIMAALAASRFGAGLTTLVQHEPCVVPPELMHDTSVPPKATALAVGPGLGAHFDAEFLQRHIVDSSLPLVLDADAFYAPQLLEVLTQTTRKIVLTPHPKEFVSMWKILTNETLSVEALQQERFKTARRFSERYPDAVLVLKGANVIIAHRNRLYVNALGTPALAKGGSGDILTGLIVALLAQGYDALDAAVQGSLAHTLAARAYEGNDFAMLPVDLIEALKRL
jgi:hydroxyethylthiazole kinase-like uncharacterized protein yjeF